MDSRWTLIGCGLSLTNANLPWFLAVANTRETEPSVNCTSSQQTIEFRAIPKDNFYDHKIIWCFNLVVNPVSHWRRAVAAKSWLNAGIISTNRFCGLQNLCYQWFQQNCKPSCGNKYCPLSRLQWPEAASFSCFRFHTQFLSLFRSLIHSVLSRTDQSFARYSQLNALANRRLKRVLPLTFRSRLQS